MQLQQELASVQGGGGASREELPRLDQEIANQNRIYQGTEAAMEDAGCFESFFIFGRGVVRSPRCLSMNARLEDARRQLKQMQDRRDAVASGQGDRRRVADLQDALARNGCPGGQSARRGGGLFDWFGGGSDDNGYGYDSGAAINRSILPNVPYRTVCVRLCDGFYYPISYSVYSGSFGRDENQCQQNCAAPAELYVYQNPGQEVEQAISLNGSPYVDLPVAFKYRKEFVKGCSCKQTEYNPTEIEAEKMGDAKGKTATAKAAPVDSGDAGGAAGGAPTQLNLDMNDNPVAGGDDTDETQPGGGEDLSPGAAEAEAILKGNGNAAGGEAAAPSGWAPLPPVPQNNGNGTTVSKSRSQ